MYIHTYTYLCIMTRARDIPADPRSRNQALCTPFFPVPGCLRGIWFCRRLKRAVLRMRSRENEGSLRRFIRHKGTAFQSRYLSVPSRGSQNAPRNTLRWTRSELARSIKRSYRIKHERNCCALATTFQVSNAFHVLSYSKLIVHILFAE